MARIKINQDGHVEVTGSGFNRELRLENNRVSFDAPLISNDKMTFDSITSLTSESLNNITSSNTLQTSVIPVKVVEGQTITGNLISQSLNTVNVIKDYIGNKKTPFFGFKNTKFSPEKILESSGQKYNYMEMGHTKTDGNVLFEMHEFWPEIGYSVTPTSGSSYTGSGYFSNIGGISAVEYNAINIKKQKPYWWSSENEIGYVKEKDTGSAVNIDLGEAYFASPNVRLKRNYIPNIFKIGLLHHSIFQTAGYPIEYTEISGGIKPPKLMDSVISESKITLNANATENENLNSIFKDFVFDSMQVGDPVKITYGLWSGSVGYDVNNTPFDLLWGFAGSWEGSGFKNKGITTSTGNSFDFTGDVFKSTLKHNFPFFQNSELKPYAVKQFAEWTNYVAFADQNPLTPTFESNIDTINIPDEISRNYYRYGRYYWTDGATGWVQGATNPSVVDINKFDTYGTEPVYKLNTSAKSEISNQIPTDILICHWIPIK